MYILSTRLMAGKLLILTSKHYPQSLWSLMNPKFRRDSGSHSNRSIRCKKNSINNFIHFYFDYDLKLRLERKNLSLIFVCWNREANKWKIRRFDWSVSIRLTHIRAGSFFYGFVNLAVITSSISWIIFGNIFTKF